ncbi:MAG: FimV/HubP family polar landmark protein [Gammaproteobacteria bacterium]|nr:FimV/HubP family polar landmark protein [Gammaproteobacteria bacterium]
MTRKLATLLLATALGLGHGTVHALGLGEIAVESALDQPFEARIELRNVGSLERNEVIVNLASAEDFERVGVERFFFLSGLEFETDLSDPDGPLIQVTSDRAITEPFVNFVVEVLWPSGRLLREYTVLLDPPTYGEGVGGTAQVPSVSGGGRADAPAARPASRPTTGAEPGAETNAAADDGEGRLQGDEYGVTGRNDTLWAIAAEARPNEVSVQQTMLALLRTNPEAFIGGNIDQLEAGLRAADPGCRTRSQRALRSRTPWCRWRNTTSAGARASTGNRSTLGSSGPSPRAPAPPTSGGELRGGGENPVPGGGRMGCRGGRWRRWRLDPARGCARLAPAWSQAESGQRGSGVAPGGGPVRGSASSSASWS